MAKGLLNRYAISYVDAHRKELTKRYKNDDAFVADFEVTDEMLAELVEMADKEKVEFDQEQFDAARPLFAMIVKALIGRDAFDDQTYFKVYNTYDPIFKEALRVINSDEYDQLLNP
jgi:carboxyl-terminal processing protease